MGPIKLKLNRGAVEEGCPVERTERCLAYNHLLFVLYIVGCWHHEGTIGMLLDRVIGRQDIPREGVGSDLAGADVVRITHCRGTCAELYIYCREFLDG